MKKRGQSILALDLISSRLQLRQHLGTHDPDFAGVLRVMIQLKSFNED